MKIFWIFTINRKYLPDDVIIITFYKPLSYDCLIIKIVNGIIEALFVYILCFRFLLSIIRDFILELYPAITSMQWTDSVISLQ